MPPLLPCPPMVSPHPASVPLHCVTHIPKSQLVDLFGSTRDEWMAADLEGWLAPNRIYPGVADAMRALMEAHEVYIVTTKQARGLQDGGLAFGKVVSQGQLSSACMPTLHIPSLPAWRARLLASLCSPLRLFQGVPAGSHPPAPASPQPPFLSPPTHRLGSPRPFCARWRASPSPPTASSARRCRGRPRARCWRR